MPIKNLPVRDFCRLTILLFAAFILSNPQGSTQTVYRDVSAQLPPEPPEDPGQGPQFDTNTGDSNFFDMDGDGDQDIYIADGTNNVFGRPNRLLRNDGNGNYTDVSATNLPPSSNLPFTPGPSSSQGIDTGDVDGDGDLDIVVANLGNNELFLNDGQGVFSNGSFLIPPTPPGPIFPFNGISTDADFADVDNDGDLDIFIAQEIPPVPPFGPNGSPNLLYIQQADGSFVDESSTRFTGEVTISQEIVILDINNDGHPDVIEANIGQNQIFINDGNGFFTPETATRLPAMEQSTRGIDLGDIDGDGDMDIVLANSNAQQNQIYLNDGTGVFTDDTAGRLPPLDDTSVDAELIDVDFDGDLDLLFANSSLIFNPPPSPPSPGPAPNPLYLNDGNGFFTPSGPEFLPESVNSTFEIEIGDANGDLVDDIFFSNANDTNEELFVRIILPPTPTFKDPKLQPFMHCIEDNNDGTYTAYFGYTNDTGGPVYIPFGTKNRFVFNSNDDGEEGNGNKPFSLKPPVVFLGGGTNTFPSEVFAVTFTKNITWKLNGHKVKVKKDDGPSCGTAITAKSAGKNKSIQTSYLTSKAPIEKYFIYPNPSAGALNILGIEDDDQIQLYDLTGRKIFEAIGKQQMELDHIQPGMYLIRVNGKPAEKWIKMK